MDEPNWLTEKWIVEAHDAAIEMAGGIPGIRDAAMLDNAVNKPKQTYYYDENAKLADLAACYTFGIIMCHPFVDGNKRSALVCGQIAIFEFSTVFFSQKSGLFHFCGLKKRRYTHFFIFSLAICKITPIL